MEKMQVSRQKEGRQWARGKTAAVAFDDTNPSPA
jgi:hypothetical protein